jgi:hypothetical protein
MHRFGIVDLPAGLEVIGTIPVIAVAALLYMVEFVADKVPYIDTLWDSIHTFIRPAAGALLSYGAVGDVDAQWQVIAALLGGGVALTSHAAKASTRVAANVSPEPFSNWILSLAEDGLSFFLVWLSAAFPLAALLLVFGLATFAVYIVWRVSHFAGRVFRRT